jgi:hypothetical protein
MSMRAFVFSLATSMVLAASPAIAQEFEAVHAVSFDSSSHARAALDSLMKDPAMAGAKVTLYESEFGSAPSSQLIVQDFGGYAEYMDSTARRQASPGWTRYLLETRDSKYHSSDLSMVVADHGATRRSAGYLAAYLISTSDPATYAAAVADLNKAIGNPGVLRLVQMRTGDMGFTHVVLIGGADFKAVNEYMDKMYSSEAFAKFVAKVRDTRKVVGINMYRRVATWGD